MVFGLRILFVFGLIFLVWDLYCSVMYVFCIGFWHGHGHGLYIGLVQDFLLILVWSGPSLCPGFVFGLSFDFSVGLGLVIVVVLVWCWSWTWS